MPIVGLPMARIRCPRCPNRCPAPPVSQSGELSAAWNPKHGKSLREFLRESQMMLGIYEAYFFVLYCFVMFCHETRCTASLWGFRGASLLLAAVVSRSASAGHSTKNKHAAWTNSVKHKELLPRSIETCEVQSSVVSLSLYWIILTSLVSYVVYCWLVGIQHNTLCSFSTLRTPQCPGLNWLRQWFGRICRLPTLKPIAFERKCHEDACWVDKEEIVEIQLVSSCHVD